MLALAAVLSVAASCLIPPNEVTLQQSLPYEAFDSRGAPFGWRYLNEINCTDAALALVRSYAAVNGRRLTQNQCLEIAFHSGQALAFAGRDQESIAYFQEAVSSEAPAEWQTYVNATLAFLRRDPVALASARAAYAKIAPDSMRLQVIDGFVACPNEPYTRAAHCRM